MVFVFIEKDHSPLYKKCASADTGEKLAEIVVKMTTALKNFQFCVAENRLGEMILALALTLTRFYPAELF